VFVGEGRKGKDSICLWGEKEGEEGLGPYSSPVLLEGSREERKCHYSFEEEKGDAVFDLPQMKA